MFNRMPACAGCVVLALLVGCTGGYTPPTGVIVKGKLVQGGQPVAVAPSPGSYDGAEVFLFSASESVPLADTSIYPDADGSFRIDYNGGGVPPGKYKVAVLVHKGGPETDLLEGKLSKQNTKIEFDIPADKLGKEHDLGVIDIAEHIK